MIRVQVSPSLIERFLETGSKSHQTEIVEGIPCGARLASVRYHNGYVEFFFTEWDRVPDRDVNIIVKTIYPKE